MSCFLLFFLRSSLRDLVSFVIGDLSQTPFHTTNYVIQSNSNKILPFFQMGFSWYPSPIPELITFMVECNCNPRSHQFALLTLRVLPLVKAGYQFPNNSSYLDLAEISSSKSTKSQELGLSYQGIAPCLSRQKRW